MPLTCPSCRTLSLERIPRSFWQKKLSVLIPLKRYQCMRCRKKVLLIERRSSLRANVQVHHPH